MFCHSGTRHYTHFHFKIHSFSLIQSVADLSNQVDHDRFSSLSTIAAFLCLKIIPSSRYKFVTNLPRTLEKSSSLTSMSSDSNPWFPFNDSFLMWLTMSGPMDLLGFWWRSKPEDHFKYLTFYNIFVLLFFKLVHAWHHIFSIKYVSLSSLFFWNSLTWTVWT